VRTTIDIDDDVLLLAKRLAQERAQSLGQVVSDLIRRGLRTSPRIAARPNAIPILSSKRAARPVTARDVGGLLESEH
jgi:hypothetical protein